MSKYKLKTALNKIKQLRKYEAILWAVQNAKDINSTRDFPYCHWIILKFIKQIFIHANGNDRGEKILKTYNYFHNALLKVPDEHINEEKIDLNKWIIKTAHEQFEFQNYENKFFDRMGRQSLLLKYLDNELLSEICGDTDPREYLSVLLFLYLFFKEKKIVNERDLLKSDTFNEIEEHIQTFIIDASFTFEDFKRELIRQDHHLNFKFNIKPEYLINNITRFRYKPLLKKEDLLMNLNPATLCMYISYFIYNSIRSKNNGSQAIGVAFEDYIDEQNKKLPKTISVTTEPELENKFKILGHSKFKVVDSVLIENNSDVICLEYKSCSMPPPAHISPSQDKYEKFFRDSLVKAVCQWYRVRENYNKTPFFEGIDNFDESKLIIVTYGETYFSSGALAKDEFLFEALKKIEGVDPNKINFSNIFIMSIDEYERMLTIKPLDLNGILNHAREKLTTKNYKESFFHFTQVLDKYDIHRPEHLSKEFECLKDIAVSILKS